MPPKTLQEQHQSAWLASQDPHEMMRLLSDNPQWDARKRTLFCVACCRQVWHLLEREESRAALATIEEIADGARESTKASAIIVNGGQANLWYRERIDSVQGQDRPLFRAAWNATDAVCNLCAEVVPGHCGPDTIDNVLHSLWRAEQALAGNLAAIDVPTPRLSYPSFAADILHEIMDGAWINPLPCPTCKGAKHISLGKGTWKTDAPGMKGRVMNAAHVQMGCAYCNRTGRWDWTGHTYRRDEMGDILLSPKPLWLTPLVEDLTEMAYLSGPGTGKLDQACLCVLCDALEDAGIEYAHALTTHIRSNVSHVRGCWALDVLRGKG